jgi:hypothetical protein
MSVNIFGLAFLTEVQARTKKGRPHQPDHGSGQHQLQPAKGVVMEQVQEEQWDGEHDTDDESTGKIDPFGIRVRAGQRDSRLEGHAAAGTGSGMVAVDLGIHRTDVVDGDTRSRWCRWRHLMDATL